MVPFDVWRRESRLDGLGHPARDAVGRLPVRGVLRQHPRGACCGAVAAAPVVGQVSHKLGVGALCAGIGGIELGLRYLGLDGDLLWVSETHKHASRVLDERFGVPNLGDLTKIVDPPRVDIVTAGFPCQPVSHAGKGAGVHDSRWLIRDVVRIATAADARWILLENVRGLLSANKGEAFGQVLDALADGGFDVEWSCQRADQSVGACHRRERWWGVATYTGGERHGSREDSRAVGLLDGRDENQAWQRQRAWEEPVHRVAAVVADSDDGRLEGVRADHRLGEEAGEACAAYGFGPYEPAVRRWERVLGRVAPAPTDDRGATPAFMEWMQGFPSGWCTDPALGLSRTAMLETLGNSVVPLAAAAAYGHLLGIDSA